MSQKKTGRPTDYRPEYCQMLIDHMSQGYSYECFGGVVNASKQTVYNWETQHPAFLDAKKLAFGKCQQFWERIALETLVTGDKDSKLNSAVWIFNMKNRFNWTDKREVTGATDITVHRSKEQKQFIEDFKKSLEASSNERKQS